MSLPPRIVLVVHPLRVSTNVADVVPELRIVRGWHDRCLVRFGTVVITAPAIESGAQPDGRVKRDLASSTPCSLSVRRICSSCASGVRTRFQPTRSTRHATASIPRTTGSSGGTAGAAGVGVVAAGLSVGGACFENTVRKGVRAVMGDSGQSCNAPTCMLVPGARMDDAMAIAWEAAERLTVGDPTRMDTDLGPIAYDRQYGKVVELIRKRVDEGASLVTGGPERPHWRRQRLLRCPDGVRQRHGITIAREEIFGPVLSIMAYRDREDAIAIANDTPYAFPTTCRVISTRPGR